MAKSREPSKNIPLWLYKELEQWVNDDFDTDTIKQHVARVIAQKTSNEADHIIYSAAHDPRLSDEDREAARQIYVERRGIPKDFRW